MNTYKNTKKLVPNFKFSALACGAVLAVTLLLGACAPRVETRGNAVRIEDVANIKIGTYTRNNVFEILGSPSSTSDFGDETWYYISQLTETTAFLAPVIKNRQIIKIKFDDKGIVTYADVVDTEQARIITPAKGETPTAGNSLSFIEQILSNLGRFNKK